jgi:hypothetical protein
MSVVQPGPCRNFWRRQKRIAPEFHGWHAPCGKLDHKRSRPVPGLNRPKRVRRTDNGIDEPACLCGYRVWVERGKRRRRPDSGAAYLASVGPVTVLYYPSLCRSSSPRQTYGAAVGCSKLLTFQTSSKTFPEPADCLEGHERRFRHGRWMSAYLLTAGRDPMQARRAG